MGLSAQTEYAATVREMANALNARIAESHVSTVLISGFKRVDGDACELNSTLTLDMESAISELTKPYRLLDRQNLEALAEEHKLDMQGMMDDEQVMREAGKLLKADMMVFGYYTYTKELLVLRIKAVDIQTAEQVAVISRECTASQMIRTLCGKPAERTTNTSRIDPVVIGQPEHAVRKAPDQAVNSADCMTKRLGNYCLKNNGSIDLSLYARLRTEYGGQSPETLLVRPGQTECFYNRPEGAFNYTLSEVRPRHPVYPTNNVKVVGQGSIQITPCGNGLMTYP